MFSVLPVGSALEQSNSKRFFLYVPSGVPAHLAIVVFPPFFHQLLLHRPELSLSRRLDVPHPHHLPPPALPSPPPFIAVTPPPRFSFNFDLVLTDISHPIIRPELGGSQTLDRHRGGARRRAHELPHSVSEPPCMNYQPFHAMSQQKLPRNFLK
ncbi:hypothetical protein ANANG_G00174160 [Anguilla anguilla]|uniref:Uncharacterized protein n=1 Tax=Anguilla anguilla TaxID=7936 RepID=A0A9D3MAQ0_ANGAN|nr:hypothetical protein ANANG_G00174160 [Anguilla anguilla]